MNLEQIRNQIFMWVAFFVLLILFVFIMLAMWLTWLGVSGFIVFPVCVFGGMAVYIWAIYKVITWYDEMYTGYNER